MIRTFEAGEGLLLVSHRYGEQLPPGKNAACVLRGYPDDAA